MSENLGDELRRRRNQQKHQKPRPDDAGVRQAPNGALHQTTQSKKSAELIFLKDVIVRPVEWLWDNHLAIGKLTIFSGDSELGKSNISCDLIARLTSTQDWPDRSPAPIGNVVIVSSEDGIEDTIVPRLMAAGADLTRIAVVKSIKQNGKRQTLNLAADLDVLGETIQTFGNVKLVVFDPVTAYMGTADSHKAASVRTVLEPLQDAGERYSFSGLLIAHPNKTGPDSYLNAVGGSAAFLQVPRLSFLVTKDPDDQERTLFLSGKNNLGKKAQGLGYRIGTVAVGPNKDILASRVIWDEIPVKVTANQALAQAANRFHPTAKADAEEFLKEYCSGQGIPADQLLEAAKANQIARRTLTRAARQLGIKPAKTAPDGGWWWKIP